LIMDNGESRGRVHSPMEIGDGRVTGSESAPCRLSQCHVLHSFHVTHLQAFIVMSPIELSLAMIVSVRSRSPVPSWRCFQNRYPTISFLEIKCRCTQLLTSRVSTLAFRSDTAGFNTRNLDLGPGVFMLLSVRQLGALGTLSSTPTS
jgi:hypothetical protein